MSSEPNMDNWDPMLEDFKAGKKYERGPGAGMPERNPKRKETECKIYVLNIPDGMTADGLKTLCSGAGTPLAINFVTSKSAYIKFKNFREAELALRDLNNSPSYSVKASFAKPRKEKKGKVDELNVPRCTSKPISYKGWVYDWFQSPCLDRSSKKVPKKIIGKVPPYFSYRCEFDDPSLVMRQNVMDFKTKRECISRGRGYISTDDIDHAKARNHCRVFSQKSEGWDNDLIGIRNCRVCGMITFAESTVSDSKIFCSETCKKSLSSRDPRKYTSDTSILSLFLYAQRGSIEFLKDTTGPRIPCSIILDDELSAYERLKTLLNEPAPAISAAKDDKVLVKGENGNFLRGTVLSKEDGCYKVFLTDFGEILSADRVYEISDDLKKIISFGGKVTPLGKEPFKWSSVRFVVKERNPFGTWLCDFINTETNEEREVLLEELCPPTKLTYAPLESGCNVVISTFVDMRTVFVRRTDDLWQEGFIRMTNDVTLCSLRGKTYEKLPKHGEMCGARYEKDGYYYRAIVRAVDRYRVTVSFVDFGNEQETKLEDLIYLPLSIKKINCFAVRVRLKNSSETSSLRAVDYLNRLTAQQIDLKLTYDTDNSGEVILKEANSGEVVNQIISELTTPIWERDSFSFSRRDGVFYIESIEEISLKPGETKEIFILNFEEDKYKHDGTFWATQNRSDYLGHLNGEMKQKITEYCSYLEDDRYLPRKGELCIVKYEGSWYRGVALSERDIICQIVLIDFGMYILVETKDIRKIIKEFLEMPALAVQCTVPDAQKLNEEQKQLLIKHLKSMNKKSLKNVTVLEKCDGRYHLSIPFVEALRSKDNE